MTFRERIVFFALLASIPIQLGKHFWPPFSFIHGIRLDYLSPILYLSDILLFLLFVISSFQLKRSFMKWIISPLPLLTLIVVVIGAFFAQEKLAALYAFWRILEYSFFAFFAFKTLKPSDMDDVSFIFILWGLVQTVLSTFQILVQHSLGGVFYYLGERTFDASTPGIASFRIGETLTMRPYGTFPHPNVLAFYLLCALVLLLIIKANTRHKQIIQIAVGMLIFFGIVITFSRIVLVLSVIAICMFIFSKVRRAISLPMIISGLFLIVFLFVLRGKAELISDSLLRLELIKIGFLVLLNHLLLGVGLNNFYFHEILYQKNLTPILLQPIHNIYLLWVVQTGIAGFVVGALFVRKIVSVLSPRPFAWFLLVSVLVCGLFDHYFITLQQGSLMFALILGLYFNSQLRSGGR